MTADGNASIGSQPTDLGENGSFFLGRVAATAVVSSPMLWTPQRVDLTFISNRTWTIGTDPSMRCDSYFYNTILCDSPRQKSKSVVLCESSVNLDMAQTHIRQWGHIDLVLCISSLSRRNMHPANHPLS